MLTGTRNFTVTEALNASGGSIPSQYQDNAQRVLEWLQAARDYIGRPIIITNLYRTAEHNAEIAGAAKNSQHMVALAADFDVSGMTNHEATAQIIAGQQAGKIPAYHQVITYETDGHVHVGLSGGGWLADLQALVKQKSGQYAVLTREYLDKLTSNSTVALAVVGVLLAFFFPVVSALG